MFCAGNIQNPLSSNSEMVHQSLLAIVVLLYSGILSKMVCHFWWINKHIVYFRNNWTISVSGVGWWGLDISQIYHFKVNPQEECTEKARCWWGAGVFTKPLPRAEWPLKEPLFVLRYNKNPPGSRMLPNPVALPTVHSLRKHLLC